MKIIKEIRATCIDKLNEKIKSNNVTPENFIKHDFFFVNSHDYTHQILYWAEEN